ncbi:Laccase domain protein yfiH [Kingella potus]|uniref:Purine nucleoside phosphorylase n=1 Tax=Kingella potus TaxID=265175 RepID=A0A377R1Q1_9NEIS|nr:peptidoglycan editing factor PgeF [Kingella potus]STR00955.1 Laccase domain protein yfiH [Kingella potus]
MLKNLNEAVGLHAADGLFLHAGWPAPANVKTLVSTRRGGISQAPYASLNVGAHVGDLPAHVAHNRALVQAAVPVPLAWLDQSHSTAAVPAAAALSSPLQADASFDCSGTAACAVMTADCLPVLFCTADGRCVAAAHAGWRGLAHGVLQNTIAAMNADPAGILAYLGPAIGPDAFEVGQDVSDAFCRTDPAAGSAFSDIGGGKYLADIYALATRILRREGITQIYGDGRCTVLERDTFFSHRRDGQTGRMVSAVWLEPPPASAKG